MERSIALRVACLSVALLLGGVTEMRAAGQTDHAARHTVPALLVSDIHFDPFHDPAKAARLVDAPASEWNGILAEPPSPDQATAFAALQQRCGARGVDSSYALLQSSLRAARKEASDARFVTVSGDLVVHNFPCRFAALAPGKTQSDYTAFVEKTIAYVTAELRRTFPHVPVYVALGNNDSGCGDNRLDGGSDFLAAVGKDIVAGLPGKMSSKEREKALADFTASGSYNVMMAAPMRRTRMIVLDDLFMLTQYATCGGKPDRSVAIAQIKWLRSQLDEARRHKQRVWVMAHIPPGVDIYSTFAKMRNVCGGDAPAMFLSSDALGDALTEYADVVRLAIFAHTHMDELRLLQPGSGVKGGAVAVKMVASISPVNGNDPSFTVARVNTAAATLADYAVFAASNKTGVDTVWSKEYDYGETYHAAAVSAVALRKLVGEFRGDPDAAMAASQAYIRNFVVGDRSSLIKPLWPQYVCGMSQDTAKGFAGCVCSAGH
ncbi:MAG: metallophosphoesterase [Edaphobacter sp.]